MKFILLDALRQAILWRDLRGPTMAKYLDRPSNETAVLSSREDANAVAEDLATAHTRTVYVAELVGAYVRETTSKAVDVKTALDG